MFTSFISSVISALLINPLGIFILAVSFGVLGLVLTLMFGDKLNADARCKNWPSVQGKITSSRISERSNYDYATTRRTARYVPVIKYSYSVDGVLYHAERIGNGIYVGITRQAVEHWLKLFPLHATIPVYYDPANPGEAVLNPTTNSNKVGFALGIATSALGIFLVGLWIFRLLRG
jgi:hypothetical protein